MPTNPILILSFIFYQTEWIGICSYPLFTLEIQAPDTLKVAIFMSDTKGKELRMHQHLPIFILSSIPIYHII